jgi:hypothetical protein
MRQGNRVAANCADDRPMVDIRSRRAPGIDNPRRLGGADRDVKFGARKGILFGSIHARTLLAWREAQSLGGFAYRGACLSPNADYLVRKPMDDKTRYSGIASARSGPCFVFCLTKRQDHNPSPKLGSDCHRAVGVRSRRRRNSRGQLRPVAGRAVVAPAMGDAYRAKAPDRLSIGSGEAHLRSRCSER